MRSGRILATAATAAALVGVSAPAALAGITPNPARAGQIVIISDEGRCKPAKSATAWSTLFGMIHLNHDGSPLTGKAKIPWHAKPGVYKVTIRCKGEWGKEFTEHLRVHGRPHGGSHAGVGGSAGSHTAELAGGAAMVTLAGGGAFVLMRRRRGGQF